MWYLLSVYGLWLVAAFCLAVLVGVLVNPCRMQGSFLKKVFWLIVFLAFLVILILVLHLLRGLAGHWYEMLAFFAFVFACGLALGCLFAADEAAHAEAPVSDDAEMKRIEPVIAHVTPSSTGPADVPPLPSPSNIAPALANEADFAGSRPQGLITARHGKADDLKLISGIGKQNEGRLHGLGIWHFDQIASWTPDNVLWIGSYLSFPGRIDREKWVEQARALAAGEVTDFAKRAAAGKVASSRDDGDSGADNVETLVPKKAPRGRKPDTTS